jgi:hypothetical protein
MLADGMTGVSNGANCEGGVSADFAARYVIKFMTYLCDSWTVTAPTSFDFGGFVIVNGETVAESYDASPSLDFTFTPI